MNNKTVSKKLVEEKIETVTSEDHFSETFGSGKINYQEDRFIEFDGHVLRFTKDNELYRSLRKGDKIKKRVYATEGSSILTIEEELLK